MRRRRRSTSYDDLIRASNPIAYWRLGERTGTVALDSVSTNHGTYTNGPVLGRPGPTGMAGDGAVQFDGVNDYVSVPDVTALDLANGPFSIEAMFKRAVAGVNHAIVSKGTGAYYLRIRNDNFLNIVRSNQADIAVSSTTVPTDTNWHHVVVTYAGANGAFKFYLDGADVSTAGPWTPSFGDNATALAIGSDNAGGGDFFNGTLDEVAIYRRAMPIGEAIEHSVAAGR